MVAHYNLNYEQNRSVGAMQCNGFSIGGEDEYEGVVLIGQRFLENNRVLNLVSPFVKWWDPNMPYAFADELHDIITKCKHEVIAFLVDGKRAPETKQGDLFEDK